jgi:hypothetical protein
MDGHIDLVIGTDHGRVIAVDVLAREEIINRTLTDKPIDHIIIGNMDEDDAMEIIATSGNQLFCVDGLYGDVQWHLTSHGEWDAHGTIDGPTVLDEDGDGTDDLFFFTVRAGGEEGDTDKVMLTKVDGDGKEQFSVSLPKQHGGLGVEFSMVFANLEMFESKVGIATDRGYTPFGAGEGKHLWIVDLTYGDILFFEQYDKNLFCSPPIVVEFGHHGYVLIGLAEYSSEYPGLMVFNLSNYTESFYSIYPLHEDGNYWMHVAQVQDSDDLRISLTGSTTVQAVWSFRQGGTVWTYNTSAYGQLPYPPGIIDIDSDSQAEIIWSFGFPVIFDASTGVVEFDGHSLHTGSGGDGRIAIDDFDGDGHSEICGGSRYLHWSNGTTQGSNFGISMFDSSPVAPQQHHFPPARASDASIEEWVAIPLIVVGTSIVLIIASKGKSKGHPG